MEKWEWVGVEKRIYIFSFCKTPRCKLFFLKDICSNYNFSVGIFDSLFKIGGFCWCDAKKKYATHFPFYLFVFKRYHFGSFKKIYSKKYSILKKNLEVYLFQSRHQQIENRTGKTSRRIVNISKIFLLKIRWKMSMIWTIHRWRGHWALHNLWLCDIWPSYI